MRSSASTTPTGTPSGPASSAPRRTDLATGIAADASGVYVAGSTTGTCRARPAPEARTRSCASTTPAAPNSGPASSAPPGTDQANGVAVGTSGVYVAGFVGGALPGKTSAGGQDAFVRKYDTDGAVIWTGQFGTAAADSAAGVTVGAVGPLRRRLHHRHLPGPDQRRARGRRSWPRSWTTSATRRRRTCSLNLNASIDENGTATLNGSFTDPDAGDTHTVVINWGPGEGTTTLNLAAGVTTFSASHTYLDDNPAGTASDVYPVSATVTEPAGGSASGSTSITVNNVAPTAVNDSAVTNEDQAVTIAVLANDSDPAGALDPLQIDSVTNGSKGTTAIDTKGTADTTDDEIVYTPNAGATGSDSFTYTISDGDGGTATATVTVQIRNLVDVSGRVFDDKDNDGAL